MNAYTTISGSTAPIHDTNGNMTSGPLGNVATNFTYDKENRLRSTTAAGNGTSYTYDPLGRLTVVSIGFAYDIMTWSGWTLLARERYIDNALTETFRYTWGLDLSGTQEGAGGVGGLLCIEKKSSNEWSWQARYPHYDANGNILALTTPTGTLSATYRYDPFGNQTQSQDLDNTAWNTKNTHGFSTKPLINNLHYYGYRHYDAKNGRWINRDPIEEQGGQNLYGFGKNNCPNGFDTDGRWWWLIKWPWRANTCNNHISDLGGGYYPPSEREISKEYIGTCCICITGDSAKFTVAQGYCPEKFNPIGDMYKRVLVKKAGHYQCEFGQESDPFTRTDTCPLSK